MLGFIFLFLAFFCVFIGKRKFGSIFSPISILGFFWNFGYALYLIPILKYDYPTTQHSVFVIGSFFTFAGGCFFSLLFAKNNRNSQRFEIATDGLFELRNSIAKELNINRSLILIYIIFSISTLATTIQFFKIIGIYGFFYYFRSDVFYQIKDIFTSEAFPLAGTIFLINTILPCFALLCFSALPRNASKFTKTSLIFVIIISLSCSLIVYRKIFFLKSILGFFFVWITFHKIDKRIIAMAILLAMAIFSAIMIARSPNYLVGIDYDYLHYRRAGFSNFPPGPFSALTPIYIYLSAPFAGFSSVLKSSNYAQNFQSLQMLQPFWFFLSKVTDAVDYKQFESIFFVTPIRTNVYTYLRDFWVDFGVGGIFLCPLMIGFFGSIWFKKIIIDKSLLFYLTYIPILWCMFVAFFSNHFYFPDNIVLILFLLVLSKIVFKKKYAR